MKVAEILRTNLKRRRASGWLPPRLDRHRQDCAGGAT